MTRKKELMGLVAIALLFLGVVGCEPQGATATPVPTATSTPAPFTLEAGVLTIGIDQAWPPFQFVDDAGQATGFDVELAKAVAEKMGLKPKIIPDEWDKVQVMLRTGEIDTVWALTPTEERAKVFDFSEIYITLGIAVFVKPGSPVQKIEDLYGKPVALEVGDKSVLEALGVHYGRIRAVKVDSLGEAIGALQTDQVVAFAGTKEVGLYMAHQMDLDCRLVFDAPLGSPSTVGVKKGNTALVTKINQALAAVKAEGTYDRIYDEWFGAK